MDLGTALGVAGLAVAIPSLIQSCLAGFECFCVARHQADSSRNLIVMLGIYRLRVFLWGDKLGLLPGSGRRRHPDLEREEIRKPIEQLLERLYAILSDSRKLEKVYGVKEQAYNAAQIETSAGLFHGVYASYDKAMAVVRKTGQVPKMARWAIHDDTKFRRMLSDINDFVSSLEALTTYLETPQQASSNLATTIQELSDETELRRVQDAASQNGDQLVAGAASQRLLTLHSDTVPAAAASFGLSNASDSSLELSATILPSTGYFAPPATTASARPLSTHSNTTTTSTSTSYITTTSTPISTSTSISEPTTPAHPPTSPWQSQDAAAYTAYIATLDDATLATLERSLARSAAWAKTAITTGAVGSLFTFGVTLIGTAAGVHANSVYVRQREIVLLEMARRGVVGVKEERRREKEQEEAKKRLAKWAKQDMQRR